jgi:hypothetical protein
LIQRASIVCVMEGPEGGKGLFVAPLPLTSFSSLRAVVLAVCSATSFCSCATCSSRLSYLHDACQSWDTKHQHAAGRGIINAIL